MNLAQDISAILDSLTGKKRTFAPTIKGGNPHAYLGARQPSVNYGALPGVQGVGGSQGVNETTGDYIAVLGTLDTTQQPPTLFESGWNPTNESTGAPTVQGPFFNFAAGNSRAFVRVISTDQRPVIAQSQLSRVYSWCSIWFLDASSSLGCGGIRFSLGGKKVSEFLPIGFAGFNTVNDGIPADTIRAFTAQKAFGNNIASPPSVYRLPFDSVEICAAPSQSLFAACLLGTGDTWAEPYTLG